MIPALLILVALVVLVSIDAGEDGKVPPDDEGPQAPESAACMGKRAVRTTASNIVAVHTCR